jgi:hypothetical protein
MGFAPLNPSYNSVLGTAATETTVRAHPYDPRIVTDGAAA